MDDSLDRMRREHRVEHGRVGEIRLDEGDVPLGQSLHRLDGLLRAVRQVIDHDDLVPLLEQEEDGVASDVAGAAGHEDGSGHGFSIDRGSQHCELQHPL